MRTLLALCICVVVPCASLASDPGQPMDCSDFVFFEPGHACSIVEECFTPDSCDQAGTPGLYDNEGRFLFVEYFETITGNRIELLAKDSVGVTVLGEIEGRRVIGTDFVGPQYPTMSFDAINGTLLVTLRSNCSGLSCNYAPRGWRALISGFAPLFDILQTYDPDPLASALQFVVPVHPEGLAAADSFDTYHGTLPVDFTQAQALACGILGPDPFTPPAAGDRISVTDTLPDPGPGEIYWYVTAVNHQGEVRFGRESAGDILRGRDPGLLPVCS